MAECSILKRVLTLFAITFITFAATAQTATDKYSITTQQFLDELSDLPTPAAGQRRSPAAMRTLASAGKAYAAPVTIGESSYVPAFIRLNDNQPTDRLTAHGVKVQCKFKHGLITCLIPVDSIAAVAALSEVKTVDVSSVAEEETDSVRRLTNAYDVLSLSQKARQAGLSNNYDGRGVLVAVIDRGIDFQHIAFRDANGQSRIKRAIVSYDGATMQEFSGADIDTLTTDINTVDHGTHTSSIAGGSSVNFSGSNVTVTTNHATAAYGGMAPASDLYLVGTRSLDFSVIADAFQLICDYADAQGQPVVVSNSYGTYNGPHDGTGYLAEIIDQYFGDDHPNHICLFSSSNNGHRASTGGHWIAGNASASSPLGTVIGTSTSSGRHVYSGMIATAWSRTVPDDGGNLACRVLLLNASTGAVVASTTVTKPTTGTGYNLTSSAFSRYLSGTLRAYFSTPTGFTNEEKSVVRLTASSSGVRTRTNTDYLIAVQFYPENGSCQIDAWASQDPAYFTSSPSTSGYTWTDGSDDCSVGDNATIDNAIPVGSYVSKNRWLDYAGSAHSVATNSRGDISDFSSYQAEGCGPTGKRLPWITAPGETVVSAVNHFHTSGTSSYLDGRYRQRINNSTTYPYGTMQGTSMACPAAAGIVALWLQAANEKGSSLTVNQVKTIMAETAIHDSFTDTGANNTHFGNGKINALGGINYILTQIATSIQGITTVGAGDTNEATSPSRRGWYTVSGIRLATQPTTPGLYIHDGKTVVVGK